MNVNMKFFDYKFIILLALTLIIYFIYREVDSLNERITKLENNMKQEETKQIKNEVSHQVLHEVSQEVPIEIPVLNQTISLPEYNSKIILSKDSFAPKNISIDLLPTNNNTLYSVVSSDSESESDYEDEDETTYSTSHASKHLAIYSNDNEQTEDTHHSLLESVKLNNKLESFDFNYNDIIKEDLSENIDLNCNSESSEHVELTIVNNNTIESDSESSEINLESTSSEVKLESESSEVKLESESSKVKLDSESSEVKLESESSKVKLESESSKVKLESESSESGKKVLKVKLESESPEVKLESESPEVKLESESSESVKKVLEVKLESESSESVKKVLEASESPKNKIIEESESSSSDINIVVKTTSSDTKRKYDRMKLQELQNVAQTMEINLVKKSLLYIIHRVH